MFLFNPDHWQEIGQTVRKHKLRTFLTAFSVAWGIFMLILLLGAGKGLENGVRYQFRDDATNSIWITPRRTSVPYRGLRPGRSVRFTDDDYRMVRDTIGGVEHITARFVLRGDFRVRYGDEYSTFGIRSVHPDHLYLENTLMQEGRFINELDIRDRRKVAAIGTRVVTSLFGRKNPIGEWIDINGIQYRVVGVFHDIGGEGEQRMIYIPISTGQVAYGGGNQIHRLMFTIGDASFDESKLIESKVVDLLSERHVFDPEDPRAMRVANLVEHYEQFAQLFKGIAVFVWLVGLGTIIAGIVGVSNIMFIAVKERTREIGIRKALGAPPSSIIGLFLLESITITVLAGYLGMVAGIGLIEGVQAVLQKMPSQPDFFRNPSVDFWTAATATLVLILAGVTAGYFPARRAAAVDPIEALRDE
ncbi:ABC transporter permease [Sulfidibacter corallicola]|uniref:ABC transporter permease n=1 Tax=Sulfidibacter corallicola TaxID=2818388 RepID=A0A8A4TN85_SULCO|nr:ABC transporter permease [Sulfidibacter corallicola]QTD51449.1 ABC transporter permease [Sulfidibacter corallicola]